MPTVDVASILVFGLVIALTLFIPFALVKLAWPASTRRPRGKDDGGGGSAAAVGGAAFFGGSEGVDGGDGGGGGGDCG
jgi:hypothetical protein